jgi:NADPH:quinone reductase
MKRLSIAKFGITDNLGLEEYTLSAPQGDQVIVEHELIGFNPVDFKIVEGSNLLSEKIAKNLPWTPGFDICGRITAVGPECRHLKIGERVCGMIGFPLKGGGYATHSLVSETELVPIPAALDARLALTCCLSGLTALEAYDFVSTPKRPLLILGATGGVGVSLMGITRFHQRETFGTYRSPEGQKFLERNSGISSIALSELDLFFNKQSEVDVIDLIGGEIMVSLMRLQAKKIRRLVTVPSFSAQQILAEAQQLGIEAKTFIVSPSLTRMGELVKIMENQTITSEIGEVISLKNVSDVFRMYQSGNAPGKIFIDPK